MNKKAIYPKTYAVITDIVYRVRKPNSFFSPKFKNLNAQEFKLSQQERYSRRWDLDRITYTLQLTSGSIVTYVRNFSNSEMVADGPVELRYTGHKSHLIAVNRRIKLYQRP